MHVKKKTNHHRKPVSLGGSSHKSNISRVTLQKHQCFHLLFANMTPEQIADELNRIWIDPAYRMVAVNRQVGLTVGQMLAFREDNNS